MPSHFLALRPSWLRSRRSRALQLLGAAACAAALAPATARADDLGTLEHRTYILESATGYVADVDDWSTQPDVAVVGWWQHGGTNQQWILERETYQRSEVTYRIKNVHSGLCLGSYFGEAAVQNGCIGAVNFSWVVSGTATGGYWLENYRYRHRFLRTERQAGAALTLEEDDGDAWFLRETKHAYSDETAGVPPALRVRWA